MRLRDYSSFFVPREGIPRTNYSTTFASEAPSSHKFIMGKETKETKKAEKELAYPFENWEIKTILQDIETSGYALEDVDLEVLTNHGNADYYGTARNPKYSDRRAAISQKIQDFKRRTPERWLAWVKGWGVTPSKFSVENAAAAKPKIPKKKQDDDEPMEDINDKFNSFGVKDNDSFGFTSHEEPASPPTTSVGYLTLTPPRNFGTKLKSPDLTPPRSVQYKYQGANAATAATAAASTLSYFTADQEPNKPFGSYERPWKFDIIPGFSGRYMNDVWIYEEAKQVKSPKDGTQKLSYSGYLFKLQVNPPDVALYSCFLADEEYVGKLPWPLHSSL